MATKEERIEQIRQHPDGTIFVVRAPNDQYWKQGDRGYTEELSEARVFSKEEIICKLRTNGLMDKAIEVFISKQKI